MRSRAGGGAGKTIEGRWAGRTVILAASGPSFAADAERVRIAACDGTPVVAINSTAFAVLEAAICYAADAAWWCAHHADLVARGFSGAMWTQSRLAANLYGLHHVQGVAARGLSDDPSAIHLGDHSGYQALGLAYTARASRVALVGYDMRHLGGAIHWHGDHGDGLRNPTDSMLRHLAQRYAHAVPQLRARGVEVVNCSRESAITCFPYMPLDEALA